MPYIQAKTTNTFGFMPVLAPGTLIRTTPYAGTSSGATINAGDVVMISSVPGQMVTVTGVGTGVFSTAGILGIAAHTLLSGDGSTAATLNTLTSGLLLVYDDPVQQFVVSDMASSVGGSLVSSQVGWTVAVLATGGVGSTGPFQSGKANSRSNQVITAATTTLTQPFKLVGLHPVDHNTSSGLGTPRKWIVAPNVHVLVPGQVTYGTT